jgi:hypothetical protein
MSVGNHVAFLLLIHKIFISLIEEWGGKIKWLGKVCNRLKKFSLFHSEKKLGYKQQVDDLFNYEKLWWENIMYKSFGKFDSFNQQ